MRKVKRVDNVVWAAKEIGQYPNVMVGCHGQTQLEVSYEVGDGMAHKWRIPRRLARLLAKRLNQCLDQT